MDGKRAIGVMLQDKIGSKVINVNKEIILSAGLLGSPHILMKSGIGPEDDLRNVGITVNHHLQGVVKTYRAFRLVTVRPESPRTLGFLWVLCLLLFTLHFSTCLIVKAVYLQIR